MPELTDGFEVAREITEAAKAVSDRMLADYASLSKDEERALDDLFWDLQSQAARIRTLAVGTLLAEAETSIEAINRETKRARKAIKDIGKVRQAIAIGAALLTLASAIASRCEIPRPRAWSAVVTSRTAAAMFTVMMTTGDDTVDVLRS